MRKKQSENNANGMMKLFIDQLKDVYSAESQIIKALPKLAKAASSPELRAAFNEHLEVTKGQVERLDSVFEMLELSPKGKKCAGMEGLLEEGNEVLEAGYGESVLDAGLIAAAQRVEHYEIAAYGTLVSYAEQLGQNKAAKALQRSLAEEREADEQLTELAESTVNLEAASAASE